MSSDFIAFQMCMSDIANFIILYDICKFYVYCFIAQIFVSRCGHIYCCLTKDFQILQQVQVLTQIK